MSSKEEAQKKEAFKAGRTHGISGREMFTFNPNLVQDDDDDNDAGDVVMVTLQDSDNEVWFDRVCFYKSNSMDLIVS